MLSKPATYRKSSKGVPVLKVAHRPTKCLGYRLLLNHGTPRNPKCDFSVFLSFSLFLKSHKSYFLTILGFLGFAFLTINQMTVVVFDKIESSAVFCIKCTKESVFVTFNGNIDKEYEYNCKNIEEFANTVKKVLNDTEKSIGRYINTSIRDNTLQLIKADQ